MRGGGLVSWLMKRWGPLAPPPRSLASHSSMFPPTGRVSEAGRRQLGIDQLDGDRDVHLAPPPRSDHHCHSRVAKLDRLVVLHICPCLLRRGGGTASCERRQEENIYSGAASRDAAAPGPTANRAKPSPEDPQNADLHRASSSRRMVCQPAAPHVAGFGKDLPAHNARENRRPAKSTCQRGGHVGMDERLKGVKHPHDATAARSPCRLVYPARCRCPSTW